MSTSKPGGSGRRRIAGDAARRRREAAARATQDEAAAEEPSASALDEAEPEPEESTEPGTGTEPEPEPDSHARSAGLARRLAPPRETWWWLAVLAVVCVAALVFVGVVGARYLDERSDDAALAESREDGASAAATAAEKILSYDYQDLDADRVEAGKLMTGDFAKQYRKLFTQDYCDAFPVQGECTVKGTFPEVVKQNKQQVTASVVDVAPMECGDGCSDSKARVLMFIDQASSANGKQQAPVGQRAVFTMVERDGEWLVDGIAYV